MVLQWKMGLFFPPRGLRCFGTLALFVQPLTYETFTFSYIYLYIFLILKSFPGPGIRHLSVATVTTTTYCTSAVCYLFGWEHTHTHTVQVSQKHLSCIYIQSTWFLWFSVALMSSVLFMAVQAEKKMPNSDSRSVPQRVNNQTLWLCVNTTLLLNQAFWDPASFKHGSRGNVRKSDPLFYCKTNKHESFVPKRNLKEYISDFSLMKSSLCVFVDLKKLFPEQILIWNTTLRSYLLLSSTFVLQTPLIKPGCGSVILPPGDCCGLNRSPLRSWI